MLERLCTGNESSVERLLKQIGTFMSDIADEFKIVVVEAIRSLCLKFPQKYRALMNFLSNVRALRRIQPVQTAFYMLPIRASVRPKAVNTGREPQSRSAAAAFVSFAPVLFNTAPKIGVSGGFWLMRLAAALAQGKRSSLT